MRTEYLGQGMPNRIPLTFGTVVICLLLGCTVIGILVIPSVLIATSGMRARGVNRQWDREVRRRFIAFIGAGPEHIDTAVFKFEDGFRGTGMAYHDGKIFVMQAGHAVELDWSDVRRWSYNVEAPDLLTTSSTDMRVTSQVLSHNLVNAYRSARNSGVTLQVASITSPRWTFTTSDVHVCERWMEILSQVDEQGGRLAA
ncbi:DUF4755 domain-containing protein [Methylorubrum populi]